MLDLKALAEAIVKGQQKQAVDLTQAALREGAAPKQILEGGLIAGMGIVGNRFQANEFFVPEVLMAARAMKMALAVLEPELAAAGVKPVAKVVIGTVKGDLHDIGKNLVAMMLRGAGYEVLDLGADVASSVFVDKAKSCGAQVIGLSALLTTTMPGMKAVVEALKNADAGIKVIIGGAPVSRAYAQQIGAHGYAADAASAVDEVKRLLA